MNASRLAPMVVALSLASGPLSAQATCNAITFVTVLDEVSNKPIEALAAADFRAQLDGRPLAIRSVTPPPRNRRFVFVLDRSGSMTGVSQHLPQQYDPRVLAPLVLKDAISAISKNDLVAFREFAGAHSRETAFVDPDTALHELPDLLAWSPSGKSQPGGGQTPLWDNMEAAFRIFGPHQPGDVMVAISDGGDNESRLRESQIRTELVAAGVPVLAIVLAGEPGPPGLLDGTRGLIDLANSTGGMGTFRGIIPSGEDLGAILQVRPSEAISALSHQYELLIEAPEFRKAMKWQLALAPSSLPRRVRLLFPRFLPSCSEAP